LSHKEFEQTKVYTERIPTQLFLFPFFALPQTGENMAFITIADVTALCLLLPVTRIYGVIGVGILLYFRPVLSLGVLALAGIAYYFYRRSIA
jgi:hypothetical protein